MTGEELKTMAESLIDDSIDEVLFYQLLNVAKTKLEEKKDWEYLKTFDDSNSVDSSTNYLTMFDLPERFRSVAKLYLGDDSEYLRGVQFEERAAYRNTASYYIDYANEKFALTGSYQNEKTINMFYLRYTEKIESGTSPIFPERFHEILSFMVAGYYTGGVDADDIYARMSPAHKYAAQELELSMNMWDNKIKLNSIDNSSV